MGGRLGEVIADPPPILARPHRNVVGLAGLFPSWLLAFTPRESVVEVRRIEDLTSKSAAPNATRSTRWASAR